VEGEVGREREKEASRRTKRIFVDPYEKAVLWGAEFHIAQKKGFHIFC